MHYIQLVIELYVLHNYAEGFAPWCSSVIINVRLRNNIANALTTTSTSCWLEIWIAKLSCRALRCFSSSMAWASQTALDVCRTYSKIHDVIGIRKLAVLQSDWCCKNPAASINPAIGLQPDPRASRSWVWLRQTSITPAQLRNDCLRMRSTLTDPRDAPSTLFT